MAHTPDDQLRRRLAGVRAFAMDVDGVLTDGGLYISADGAETKRFHVADGLGLWLLHHAGIRTAWISGRVNAGVERRAHELGVSRVWQGSANKADVLRRWLEELNVDPGCAAFMGDDLNDLPAFDVAGVRLAPANAAEEVRRHANLVMEHSGGSGAVREACEAILEARGQRDAAVGAYLATLAER